jgi:outer membrane immunogenic protein
MKFVNTATFLFAMLMSVAALAAEVEPRASVTSKVQSWSGPYFGIQAGGSAFSVTSGQVDKDGSGAAIDGVFGYNTVHGDILTGIELAVGYAGQDYAQDCLNSSWTCSGYVDWQSSLQGRLGFATDKLTIYASGGLALANVGGHDRSKEQWPRIF